MDELEAIKIRAARTYNAAAELFDHPVNGFWQRFGRRTVAGLALRPGENVLDVCSGSGASALPAAEAVGPTGKVIAVDLAADLLGLARAKAKARGLVDIEFRTGDFLALGYPDASFDAAICAFGIFFIPDMPAAVRELWRMLRPGGRLAITTWGPDIFEPANGIFWDLVRHERPDLQRSFNPWDRISDPSGLAAMLESAGVTTAEIVAEAGTHPLRCPEDWWTIVMGSGYRGTVAQLDEATYQRFRDANLSRLRATGATHLSTNVVYAVAGKP